MGPVSQHRRYHVGRLAHRSSSPCSTTFTRARTRPRNPRTPLPLFFRVKPRSTRGLPAAATVTYFARIMLAHPRTLPTGFIAPCLPPKTDKLPPAAIGCIRSSTTASECHWPQDRRAGEALQPSRQRSHPPLPADRRDFGPPALALLHYRRRSRWSESRPPKGKDGQGSELD